MVWTCDTCGYNHSDRRVEDELTTTGEVVAGDADPEGNVPMKEVDGWECDRCGRFHPTPEKPPGEPL